MEQHIFGIFTEKVLQFIMPLKSFYNRNLGFVEQEIYFELYRDVQSIKNIIIDFIFVIKIFYCDLFRAAPYRLMLALNKFMCKVKYKKE